MKNTIITVLFGFLCLLVRGVYASFKMDDLVVLNGIKDERYNGFFGIVTDVTEDGRYSVLLYNPDDPFRIEECSVREEKLMLPSYIHGEELDEEVYNKVYRIISSLTTFFNNRKRIPPVLSEKAQLIVSITGSYIHAKYGYLACLEAKKFMIGDNWNSLVKLWVGIGELTQSDLILNNNKEASSFNIVILRGLSSEEYNGMIGIITGESSSNVLNKRYKVLLYQPNLPMKFKEALFKLENLFQPLYPPNEEEAGEEYFSAINNIINSLNEIFPSLLSSHSSTSLSLSKQFKKILCIRIIGAYIYYYYGYKSCLKTFELVEADNADVLMNAWHGIGKLVYSFPSQSFFVVYNFMM